MKILIVASTNAEIASTLEYLDQEWEKQNFWTYVKNEHTISTLITGIGAVYSAFAIARMDNISTFNYIVNPGICAGLSRTVDLHRVYIVEKEGFGDLGVEEADGTFNDQFDLNWKKPNKYPNQKGRLSPKKRINPTYLPTCTSLTVNKIPGTYDNIEHFQRKYHSDILTLNGAAIQYACNMLDLQLIQFRVVSKFVEPIQKGTIDIDKAFRQLNMRTIDIIKALTETKEKKIKEIRYI